MPDTMFEGGKIKRGGAHGDHAASTRELRWTELVAQLAATRDLRGDRGRKNGDGGASGRFMSLNAGPGDMSSHNANHRPGTAQPPSHAPLAEQEPADDAASRRLTSRPATHRTPRDRESS